MRILVTGGSGQLGTDVAQAAAAKGWQVWAPDHTELDITHPAQVESAFLQGYGPVRERLDMQEEMAQLQQRIDMKKKELREARSAKNSSSHMAYVEKDLRDLNLELLQLRFKVAQMPPK